MSDINTTQNEQMSPETKKDLAKKRIFYAIIVLDCILALVLAWAIISIFVK